MNFARKAMLWERPIFRTVTGNSSSLMMWRCPYQTQRQSPRNAQRLLRSLRLGKQTDPLPKAQVTPCPTVVLVVVAYTSCYRVTLEAAGVPENAQGRAAAAWHVLNSWKSLPGLEGGVLNVVQLDAWVTRALALAVERRQATVVADYVGKLLSSSPAGPDGGWPHEAVRDVIERVEDPDLESGFEVGVFNRRGVVTRHPAEGGRQERVLPDQYQAWAAQIADRWPRTAAVLRNLERTYRSYAQREDVETDLRNDGL